MRSTGNHMVQIEDYDETDKHVVIFINQQMWF